MNRSFYFQKGVSDCFIIDPLLETASALFPIHFTPSDLTFWSIKKTLPISVMPINIPEKYSTKSAPFNARNTLDMMLNDPITMIKRFTDFVIFLIFKGRNTFSNVTTQVTECTNKLEVRETIYLR